MGGTVPARRLVEELVEDTLIWRQEDRFETKRLAEIPLYVSKKDSQSY